MENRKRFIIIVLILFIFLGLTIFTFANPKVEETGDGESDTEQKVDNDKQDNQDSDEKEDENNNENNTTDEVVDRVDDVVQNNQNHTTLDDSYDKALKAVEEAEKLVESNSYNTAKDLVDKVTDEAKKQELQNRLDEVKEGIDVKALVETLKSKTESAGNLADMNDARKFKTDEEITSKVSDLSNENLKDELNSVLDELNKLLDDEVAPKLNVEDGEIYNTFVKVEATDEEGNGAKVTIKDSNGNVVESITEDGTYTITAEDDAFNSVSVTIVVDSTSPKFNNLTSGVIARSVDLGVTDANFDYILLEQLDKEGNVIRTIKESRDWTSFGGKDFEGTWRATAYDKAGNKSDTYTFVIDATIPYSTYVEIKNLNQTTPGYAKVGDTIWVYVIINEHLSKEPTITINGVEAKIVQTEDGNKFNADWYKYVGEVVMTEDMDEGEIEFTISEYKDLAGNEGKVITNEDITADLKKIILDKTKPKATRVIMANENNNLPYVRTGERVWLYITYNEELKDLPKVKVGDIEVEITEVNARYYEPQNNLYQYTVAFTMPKVEDGVIQFTIYDAYDKAGNNAEDVTNVTEGNLLTVDNTKPTYEFVEIMNIGRDGRKTPVTPGYAIVGDRVWVNVNVSEHIPTAPTITINGVDAKIVQLEDGNKFNADWYRYVGEVVMTDDMKEGEISFTVDFKDAAGNSIETVTKPSRGLEKIVLEKSLPTVTLARVQRHTVNGVKSNWAKVGNELMIVLHASEPLYEGQEIQLEIGGQKVKNAKLQYSENNQYVAYNVPITQNMNLKNGEKIEVKVSGLIDIAGNESKVYYTTGDSDEFSTYFYNTNPTVSLTGLNDGNAHYSVEYEKPFNLVIKNSKGEIKRNVDSSYSEDSSKYYSSGKIGYLGEGTFTYEITDFAGNKTVDKFEIKTVAMSADGIVLEEFPYLFQSYSVIKTDTIIPDKKITVTSENDEEYKSFIAKGYKPVNVIWWAQFSCDETMCEGFNQHNSDVKSNLIVEGRRGDVSITMEAPKAKEGYEFVGWEASIIDYQGMKIQGFEAIYTAD